MSVINQVLNDLEQRGATSMPGGTAIRVVPVRRNWRLLWLIIVLLVMALLTANLWKAAAPPPALPEPLRITMADVVEAPTEEVKADAQKIQEHDVTPSIAPVPAMRLSYQLSVIPPLVMPNQSRVMQKAAPAAENKPSPSAAATSIKTPEPMMAIEQKGGVEKQMKQFTPQQRAENEFRRATELVQKGRSDEALEVYGELLKSDATHDAGRLSMVWLLLEKKRNEDAERVLHDGLKINLRNREFATLLARLQVERNDLPVALQTLQATLPYAEQQAEYYAFVAAVYQRMGRHNETIGHYRIALQQAPDTAVWQMGLGISLQALQRNEEARAAFKHAIETRTLSAELQAFVEQRLKEL